MRLFRNLSIRSKLTLITMMVTIAALLIASGVFLWKDIVALRGELVISTATTADMIGNNSTAALSFQNQKDGTDVLSALRANEDIEAGWILTTEGNTFATYFRDEAVPTPILVGGVDHQFGDGFLYVSRPVILDGKQ